MLYKILELLPMSFILLLFLTFISTTSVGDNEIILKSGQCLGFSRNSLEIDFKKNNTNINLAINSSIMNKADLENQKVNEVKERNIANVARVNDLIDKITKIKDEIDKGKKIKDEFETSKAIELSIKDEISSLNSTIKVYEEAMKPENFENTDDKRQHLDNFKKFIDNLKNSCSSLEDEMYVHEKRAEELRSIYEIRCIGIDPDITLKINDLQFKIQGQNQKTEEILSDLPEIKSALQNLKVNAENQSSENSKIKIEIANYEKFLNFYFNGEFDNQINQCIEKKNSILEFLKENEEELTKLLKFKLFESLDQTRNSLKNTVEEKQKNFEKLSELKVYLEEKRENETKVQEQMRKDLEKYNSCKQQCIDQLTEYYKTNFNEIENLREKIDSLNREILDSISTKFELNDSKIEAERSFKKLSMMTISLVLVSLGCGAIIFRFM